MKKGAVPELSSKWWSKNKAKTMKKSGLGGALKTLEMARERMTLEKDPKKREVTYVNTLKAISEVKKKVVVAIDCCNSKLHADTIAGLKKYPKVINELEVNVKKAQAAFKKQQSAPPPPPKQKKLPLNVYWQIDVAKKVKDIIDPDWIKDFKGYKLTLAINKDIEAVLFQHKAADTLQFMVEDCQEIGNAVVKSLAETLIKIEKSSQGKKPADVEKLRAAFKPAAEKAIAAAGKNISMVPKKRWVAFVKRHQQYKDYQIECGKTITLGVLGIAGGIAGLASSPFTLGAGTIVGLISLARGVASMARELENARREAEAVEKRLAKDLMGLEKAYRTADGKASKAKQGAAEVGSSVVKGLLGTDPLWATLPKCSDNLKLWDNKVAGIEVKASAQSKEILKGLDICDDLEKIFMKTKEKGAAAVMKKLNTARAGLSDALDKCTDYNTRVRKAKKNMPNLKKVLVALESDNPPFAKVFDKVFPTVVNLGLSGAGGGFGIKEAGSALEKGTAILGMVNDVLSEIESNIP